MSIPAPESSIDWDDWTPGSIPAARQAAKLDELIATAVGRNPSWSDRAAARGSLLASIEDHRLDRLASAVSDAVARGDSVDTLARTLRGVLDDPRWAEMVATTEMNRAMTAASLASYTAAEVPAKEFLTSDDSRVCILCQENEDAGPILITDDFPNGDSPVHPTCRCCVQPSWATPDQLGLSTGELSYLAPDLGLDDADLFAAEAEAEAFDGEEGDLEEDAAEPGVDQHDTAGETREIEPAPPLTTADLAAQGALRRAERQAAGQAAAAAPEARDLSRPSPDDLAARISQLPSDVAGLRLGPNVGQGGFRVGRRRARRNKAAAVDDDEG